MELLRIIAMAMVLLGYCGFLVFGIPSQQDLLINPIESFLLFFTHNFTVIGVNVFVLITGWFGVNFTFDRLKKILFQVFFYSFLIVVLYSCYKGTSLFSVTDFNRLFLLHSNDYWFIKAYIGLLMFTPALNLFIKNVSEDFFRKFLFLFFIIEFIYTWVSLDGTAWIVGGYSPWHFFGLYLLARYLKLYGGRIVMRSARFYFLCYSSLLIFIQLVVVQLNVMGFNVPGRLMTYTSPFNILSAVLLLLAFSRLKCQSVAINYIASSTLAVYLIHGNEVVLRGAFRDLIHSLYDGNLWFFLLKLFIVLSPIYFMSIFLDKLRIRLFEMMVANKKQYIKKSSFP